MLSLRSKALLRIVIFSLLAWSCKTLSGGSGKTDPPRVTNVHYTQIQDSVIIYYNLISHAPNERYRVHLYLSMDGGKNFNLTPQSVSGDVGADILPGNQRRIVWNVLKDYPDGINGKSYQFLIRAQPQNNNSNKNPKIHHSHLLGYLLIGGVVGLAGTAAGILIGRSLRKGLPGPPVRPH